jgi:hypothetical protein
MQTDLFALLDNAPPAKAPIALTDDVHWVVVTTRRAMTACGIVVTVLDWKEREWVSEEGLLTICTVDRYSGRVTCERCKEAL